MWSESAWAAATPVYKKIVEMPFVRELADGTLSAERFLYYQQQDALYLDTYSRVLAHIASRLHDRNQCEDFLRFALDGIMVERLLHANYLQGNMPDENQMSDTCRLYTSWLRSCGYDDVAVECAAVLPCFWVYQQVGKSIIDRATPDNPYSQWIATYADEGFERSTRRAIEICNQLAEQAGETTRRAMTDAFVTATRMEYLFWEAAYKDNQ